MLPPSQQAAQAFHTMRTVIVLALVLVIAALAWPVSMSLRTRAHKQTALERMRQLGAALSNYASQNAGALPAEDAPGNDTWVSIQKPEARDAWYNALPRLIGKKGAGDFATPQEFYNSDTNVLVLPGANFPDKKKFIAPQFAIAFNTKLQRKNAEGRKERTKLEQIKDPARTVVLLEQGCLNEDRTLEVQSKNDYDGSPKGSAKSFVGRYGGEGVLCFADSHAEFVKVRDTLTETGDFPFPPTHIIWTRSPEENPNKDPATSSEKKKSKK